MLCPTHRSIHKTPVNEPHKHCTTLTNKEIEEEMGKVTLGMLIPLLAVPFGVVPCIAHGSLSLVHKGHLSY